MNVPNDGGFLKILLKLRIYRGSTGDLKGRIFPLLIFFTKHFLFFSRMVEHKELNKESVKNMRVFISGSAQLTPNVFEKFEQMTGHRILERYG